MHIDLPSHRAWVQTAGDHGPRVLLIMGFGMSGDAWVLQVRGLSVDHQVAWYDVRGLGRSTAGDGPMTLADLADDAAALLDALGWDRAHIVGVSMGGMIAQRVALRHPDRTLSLSLLTTHPGGGLWRTRPTLRGLSAFLASNLLRGHGRLLALGALLFPARQWWNLPLDLNDLGSLTAPSHPRTRLKHLAAIGTFDVRDRLVDLADLPVLLVRAGVDLLVPAAQMDLLLDLLPHATVLELPRAGHGALLQEADAINRALRAHVAAAEAATA